MNIVKASEENLRKASLIIRDGGVVIYPTETVYGLGANPAARATSQEAEKALGNKINLILDGWGDRLLGSALPC